MRTSSEILLLSFMTSVKANLAKHTRAMYSTVRRHVFTQTPKQKSIKKALIKPRYLKAFPPHHLQWRKAILVDWMLHDVICWHLRPSLESLDHLSSIFLPKLRGPTGLRNWQSFCPQVPQVWHGKSSRCHKCVAVKSSNHQAKQHTRVCQGPVHESALPPWARCHSTEPWASGVPRDTPTWFT